MADFSKWKRDNLERVANEMLARLVNTPSDEPELLDLLLLRSKIKQQQEESESEQRWADHYHAKLIEARKRGFLPDDFLF